MDHRGAFKMLQHIEMLLHDFQEQYDPDKGDWAVWGAVRTLHVSVSYILNKLFPKDFGN